jgi:hypothetical protein
MSIILDDIKYSQNIMYNVKLKTFNNSNIDSNITMYITEPVIIIHTLHFCYAHALIDMCFSLYWLKQDLLKKKYIENDNIRIFILEKYIKLYPDKYNLLIDLNNRTYKGAWKDMIQLITPYEILFENTVKKNIQFKKCFQYINCKHDFSYDNFQRSIWNCKQYYNNRCVDIKKVRFSDEIIYEKLLSFRNYILQKYNVESNNIPNKNVIIIDRKYNRKFNEQKLQLLVEYIQNKNVQFNGVHLLEDISFSEQIKLFNSNNVFIFIHGSCLSNLLFAPYNSTVYELDIPSMNNNINVIKRLCKLTDSEHIRLVYDNFLHSNIIL